MNITTTVSKTFTLSDGRHFSTRAEAEAAMDATARLAKVQFLLASKGISSTLNAAMIADLGKELIAALTLPAKMGPKPKVKPAPVAA